MNARPVRGAVDPEILREAAVRPLRAGQVHQGPPRCIHAIAGQQRSGALHHIAGPDQVVSTDIVIALVLAPGDGSGGDKGAGVVLVLVGQDNVLTDLQQPSRIHGGALQVRGRARPVPLVVEALQVLLERSGDRAQGRGQSRVMSLSESDGHHKFAVMG